MYILLNKFKIISIWYNIISICCFDGRIELSICIVFVKCYSLSLDFFIYVIKILNILKYWLI